MPDGNTGSAILAGNPAAAPAPATADASAAAPTGAAAPASATPAATGGAWYDSIQDADLRGYVQNKGWGDPVELANGYRNLEKLLGTEKVPLPKGADDAEGWSRVYDALGRPKDASGYKIAVPEGGDPEFAKAAADLFHKSGLSAQQAEAVTGWYNSQVQAQMEAQATARSQAAEQQLHALRQEWGSAWDENVNLGQRAAKQFGLNGEQLAAIEAGLGTGELLKFMARIGRGLTEHSFESGRTTNGFGMTPEAAQARIAALRSDRDWSAKYLSGNADARAELEKLMTVAFPD